MNIHLLHNHIRYVQCTYSTSLNKDHKLLREIKYCVQYKKKLSWRIFFTKTKIRKCIMTN